VKAYSPIKPGDTLTARSLCDYECIYEITILKRTPKTATFKDWRGETRTSKIRTEWDGCESIRPDRWSMAPTFRAKEEA